MDREIRLRAMQEGGAGEVRTRSRDLDLSESRGAKGSAGRRG